MLTSKEKRLSLLALFSVIICLVIYCLYLQILTPTFHDPDSYYHVALSRAIKTSGLHYQFPWTQFAIFKDFFADKDFLFHLMIVPFLYLSDNIVLAGKYAVIFYNILFILTYVFILRKYLPDFLAGLFLLLPFLSMIVSLYLPQLRAVILVNILTLLGIYFLINKKQLGLFIVAFLYPLTHVSFFILILFALICESIRYAFNKELYLRNIYIVIIASTLGCILHPNFPNYLLYVQLNALIVPWYYLGGVGLDFGNEMFSYPTKMVLMANVVLFFTLNLVIWLSCLGKRIKFPTAVWLACFNLYLIMALVSNRYWYQANVLGFVFFASYTKDLIGQDGWSKKVFSKIKVSILLYLIIICLFFPYNMNQIQATFKWQTEKILDYENAARWMQRNILPGKIIYHANWEDAAFFICLNPKDNYLVACDPIYMAYYYPKIFLIYKDLREGKLERPDRVIKEIFKADYGFSRKDNKLYTDIKNDQRHFKILYENKLGIIFQILPNS